MLVWYAEMSNIEKNSDGDGEDQDARVQFSSSSWLCCFQSLPWGEEQ